MVLLIVRVCLLLLLLLWQQCAQELFLRAGPNSHRESVVSVLRAMSSHVNQLEAQMREAKAQAKLVAQQIRSKRKCAQARMRHGETQRLYLREADLRILAITLDGLQALEQ